jgi:hypothetical protein
MIGPGLAGDETAHLERVLAKCQVTDGVERCPVET